MRITVKTIQTERLILRQWREEDFEAFAQFRTADSKARRCWRSGPSVFEEVSEREDNMGESGDEMYPSQ